MTPRRCDFVDPHMKGLYFGEELGFAGRNRALWALGMIGTMPSLGQSLIFGLIASSALVIGGTVGPTIDRLRFAGVALG